MRRGGWRRGRAQSTAKVLVAVWLLSGMASAATAQGTGDLDDLLGGFDDDAGDAEGPDEAEDEPAEQDSERPWSWRGSEDDLWELSGDASLGSSYNYRSHRSTAGTSYGNLSRLRAQLDLQLDLRLPAGWKARVEGWGFYDFAYLAHGRSQYTSEVLDTYEYEVDFRELWIGGSPTKDLDLKLGRQIVNWGRSDTLRVVDIINPLDNREPGLVDIEDLRRAVGMARVDYYPPLLPEWAIQLLLIPEFRRDKNPPFGSDFNPTPPAFRHVGNGGPRHWGAAPEYAAAINGTFSGWDVSVYGARVYENTRFVQGGIGNESQITMVGGGSNLTLGAWLFKAETAWFDGVEYGTRDGLLLGTVDKSRLDVMAGVEYYGWNDIQVAFEVVNRHIFDFDSRMKFFRSEDELESAIRLTMDLLNSRLHLTALGFILGERAQDGSVVRLEANYDLRDSLVVGVGIVLAQEGDHVAVESGGRNDRVFARIEYSF
jgi:hypothetical protein